MQGRLGAAGSVLEGMPPQQTTESEAAAEAAAAAALAGLSGSGSAIHLTLQQAEVVARWEQLWQELGLDQKHGPRCSAPDHPGGTCPPDVVRVVVRALPPRDQREPVPADWVPKRDDRYYLSPDGRHENTVSKLRTRCPHLDWGEQEEEEGGEATGTPAAAAAATTRKRKKPRQSAGSADAQQPAGVTPEGAHAASAGSPIGTGNNVAGEIERGRIASAGGVEPKQSIDELAGVCQHLAGASQTLQALAVCAQQVADGTPEGQMQARLGLLDIRKAAKRGSETAALQQAALFQKLADTFNAIHREFQ